MSDEPPSHRPPPLTASAHRLRSPASAHRLPPLVSYFAAWLGVISAMIAVLEEGGIDRSAVMAKVADAKTLLAEEIATEFLCAAQSWRNSARNYRAQFGAQLGAIL